MAGPAPSLAGVLQVLEAAGPDKLVSLRLKLRTPGPGGCPGTELLRAMVLPALGRDEEVAQDDAVAQRVAQVRAGVDGTQASGETAGEVPDVSWAVAHLYHLLAEEKLCPESMRDAAYSAALRVLEAHGDRRLEELRNEAQARCGWATVAASRPQDDLPTPSPPSSGARSQPWPISALAGWSHACSLRSCGSPGSVGAELEISQSPTLPFLSPHRGTHGPSKLSWEAPGSPEPWHEPRGHQEPEEVSWPSSVEPLDPDRLHPSPGHPETVLASVSADSTVPPDGGSSLERTRVFPDPISHPVASLDPTGSPCPGKDHTPSQSPEDATRQSGTFCPAPSPAPDALSSHPQASSSSSSSSATFPPASSSASFSPASSSSASFPPASSPPDSSSLAFHADTAGQKFYNFVVLHTRADEHVALRVRERLEALGVPDGATFCEDFQLPGRGELQCLQDAIEHSGFIVLLLTAAFEGQLGLHQVNQALMSSLTRLGRQDCVVPFLPLESSEAQLGPSTTSLLTGLVWLEERSAIFTRKVANTFSPHRLRARRAHWAQEQRARALRPQPPQPQGHTAYLAYPGTWGASQAQVQALHQALGSGLVLGTQAPQPSQVPLGDKVPPLTTWPGCPQTPPFPWQAGIPPTAFLQPPSCPQPPTCPPAPTVPPQTPGPQPLIIHHAQMVQLGLNNHMWNQRGAPAPPDDTPLQEADRRNDRD
ncbi:TIR domain-containing adapter molecule 1 [Perognathus longimembris pacificus]|uniref:TIR domain-containing adapter molecule 1 n=1 Tax=Perognathus longimembris pacificus TaxID=214514 RepID=UPI00201A1127|nr:TIR domain-containing adapter molecule 1 [Perognathus longimembris pacificus]